MQTITVLGFLAMMAVSSATFCSESGGLCAPRRTKTLKEASDRKEMERSMPKEISPKLKMDEATTSSTKSQNVPPVPATKVETQVSKTESKATVSSTQSKPPVSTEKVPTPVGNMAKTESKATVSITQSKPPVSTEKVPTPVGNIAPIANAQTKQSVSSKVTFPGLEVPAKPTISATKTTAIPVVNAQAKRPAPATDNISVMNKQPRHTVSFPNPKNQSPVVSAQVRTSVLTQQKPSTPALTKATTQVQRTQGSTSRSRPPAFAPKLVLVLNVQEELNPRLKLEKKVGEKLDWSFICEDESIPYQRKLVKAHKNVVVKYSPYLRNFLKSSFPLFSYTSNIVEAIVTLMYEHVATINKADYDKIMEVANILQMKELISVLHDDVVHCSYRP